MLSQNVIRQKSSVVQISHALSNSPSIEHELFQRPCETEKCSQAMYLHSFVFLLTYAKLLTVTGC